VPRLVAESVPLVIPSVIGTGLPTTNRKEDCHDGVIPATVSAGVRAVFDNPALGRYFVAEHDTRVVAVTLTTYEWSEWRNGLVWWIQSVYVTPEYRRQGIYSGIYAFIRGLAESDPAVRGIRLYVDRRNTSAQEVYTRLGMNGEHYQVFEWMK